MRQSIMLVIAFAWVIFAGCIKDAPHTHGDIKTGDRLPSFTVIMDDGSVRDNETLSKGRSLIVFFNSLCPECKEVMPLVNAFHTRHGEEVTVTAISRSEDKTSTDSYWQENGFSIPKSSQTDATVYSLFSGAGIPLLIVSYDGVVTDVFNSYTDGKNPTEEEIERILSE